MKVVILLLAVLFPANDLTKIARANKEKATAQSAYEKGDYQKAITSYHILLDSMGINEPGITLNLGHCYFQTGNLDKAAQYYQMASTTDQLSVKTVAHHQLGIIQANKQQYESALAHFKQVLKDNPQSEEARKNYEIVKRLLEEQKKKEEENKKDKDKDKEKDKQNEQKQQNQNQQQNQQQQQQKEKEQQQQNQDKGKKDQDNNQESQKSEKQQNEANPQQNDEQKNSEQKKEEQRRQQEQLKQQRLQEMNMTKEQAQMLLEALKTQEIQYYQQLRRKSNKSDSGKPDW